MLKLKRQRCSTSRKLKRQKCSPSPSLPHDIIENMILSRLPVKDLLRFMVVCKQWEATVSDPRFAEIHLQHNKNPSSRNLLAWHRIPGYNGGLHVSELRNNSIESVSSIEFGLGRGSVTWCSCDGLYLKYFVSRGEVVKPVKCVLWNPSLRRHRELYCPPSVDVLRNDKAVRAMYYDQLMKDYKLVIADMERYAVYSCRDNKWGEVKEMKGFLGGGCPEMGVFVNGCIYWMVIDFLEPEDKYREVICFDCKDESFRRLPLPNLENRDGYQFKLCSLGGQVCLFASEWESYRLKIMKKVDGNDEWMESKEECLCE